jgi:hypothetical protein
MEKLANRHPEIAFRQGSESVIENEHQNRVLEHPIMGENIA